MIDKDVAIAALSALCNANVTSTQQFTAQYGYSRAGCSGAPGQQQLFVTDLVSSVLDADETCRVSRNSFVRLQSHLEGVTLAPGVVAVDEVDAPTGQSLIIDEDEFFDPQFDYDFTKLKHTTTYYRGQETYGRPYGWKRFAIKPGHRELYGRGIYSTPYISEAERYTKTFIHNGKRYKVILQNRINTMMRQQHNNGKYWLIPIPAGTSKGEEQRMVQHSIRPYGLLLREV